MTAETEEKQKECAMCGKNPLLPIPGPDGKDSSLLGCPNCDNPKGTMPKIADF